MPSTRTREATLSALAENVRELRAVLRPAAPQWAQGNALVAPHHHASAINAARSWAVRQHDLQSRLAAFGQSSVGRSEPRVLATLGALETEAPR